MKNAEKIKSYFDQKSRSYQSKSSSFPWSMIRKYEKKLILYFLGNIKNLSIVDVGSGSGFYAKMIYKQILKNYMPLITPKNAFFY